MIKFLLTIVLSVSSGIIYRIAGRGGFKYAKLIRRLGCSLLALLLWISLYGFKIGHIWAYLAFLALNYAALTTYHDYLAPDGESENWLCWLVTGLFYSLSAFPICIITGLWLGFIIRSIILSFGIMLLRENTGSDIKEEVGSGFLYCITMPLLFI